MPGAYFSRWESERRYRLFNINPKAIQDIIEAAPSPLHPDYVLTTHMDAPWELSIHIRKHGSSGMAGAAMAMLYSVPDQEITEVTFRVADLRIEDTTPFYGAMESVMQSIVAMHNIIRNVGGIMRQHKGEISGQVDTE